MSRDKGAAFGNWQIWPDAPELSERALAETLDGGQAFRWNRIDDFYEGRWGQNAVRLKQAGGFLQYAIPSGTAPESALAGLRRYFAVDTDFAALTEALPWRSDPVLRVAIDAFAGLRILRQPFDETLFCFLCSSTKQIPQIKAICEAVARDIGRPIPGGGYALPNWTRIAEAGEARLRAAGLGYRARYIQQTALFLGNHPGWLEEVENSPTTVARERLLQLPGVGRKIADCVLLFGAGRLDAFPIDTWVRKILVHAYSLEGWALPQLQHFARIHFGDTAGYAQQYLFAAARANLIRSTESS